MSETYHIYVLGQVLRGNALDNQPYGYDTVLNGPMMTAQLAHRFAEMSDGERKSCTLSAIVLAQRGGILLPFALEAILNAYDAPPPRIREGS